MMFSDAAERAFKNVAHHAIQHTLSIEGLKMEGADSAKSSGYLSHVGESASWRSGYRMQVNSNSVLGLESLEEG